MTTKNAQPPRRQAKKKATKTTTAQTEQTPIDQGVQTTIAAAEIEFSSLNYRRKFNQQTIDELAADIALNGMISPVTIRTIATGRYELLIGERRFRAAAIAGLQELPCLVRELTDAQVKQLQLAENMQRENPHPLDEAHGIARLLEDGKNTDDIAVILGRSKAFVYSRIKLSQLIDAIQDVFIADKMTIGEAMEIAELAAQSQQDFFDQYCGDWQDENFELRNVRYAVSRFKFELARAPFNIKDENLIPEAGACGNCPFNSATLVSLFPEMAQNAKCTNGACYKSKCNAHYRDEIRHTLAEVQLDALLLPTNLSAENKELLENIVEASGLPRYECNDITYYSIPSEPDKDDYDLNGDDEEGADDDFDDESYQEALNEYREEMEEHSRLLSEGKILKGLLINNTNAVVKQFIPEKREQVSLGSSNTITAKEVQQALKDGTATPELLQAEINRINKREERKKEIDGQNLQKAIHEGFSAALQTVSKIQTEADQIAARLIIYQSLDYNNRAPIDEMLFDANVNRWNIPPQEKYDALAAMTDEQFTLLIRSAVVNKGDSRLPGNVNALCLHRVATAAEYDVQSIEDKQAAVTEERTDKLDLRIKGIEGKIKKLEAKKAA